MRSNLLKTPAVKYFESRKLAKHIQNTCNRRHPRPLLIANILWHFERQGIDIIRLATGLHTENT